MLGAAFADLLTTRPRSASGRSRPQAMREAKKGVALPLVRGERDELVHLVQLGGVDVGERVLLPVHHALLQRDVELVEVDLLRRRAERLEDVDGGGSAGVRIFRPRRSSGWLIGRLLLVMWRMPLSHQPSEIRPTFSKACAQLSCPSGRRSPVGGGLSGNRKGRPKRGQFRQHGRRRRPGCSPTCRACRCAGRSAWRRRRRAAPSRRRASRCGRCCVSRSCAAMRSAATLRGLPGAAPWPSVSRTWPCARSTAGAARAPAAPSSAARRVVLMNRCHCFLPRISLPVASAGLRASP